MSKKTIEEFCNDSFAKYDALRKNLFALTFFKDIGHLLNNTIAFIAYARIYPSTQGRKAILKRFFQAYAFRNIDKHLQQEIMVSSVIKRPNYVRLMKNVTAHKPGVETYFHDTELIKFYNPLHVVYAFLWLLKQLVLRDKKWSRTELLYVASEMSLLLNTLQLLDKTYGKKIKAKKYVCFAASFGFDAVLTAFFKRKHIPTYSVQRSPFVEFKTFIPEEIMDYDLNYPDYYLMWSQSQINVAVEKFGQSPKGLLEAGNPNYKTAHLPSVKQSFKKCLVLLSRYYYHEGNFIMLKELASMKGIEFTVRPHPALKEIGKIDFQEYIDFCRQHNFTLDERPLTLVEVLSEGNFDFSICYNTAAYYDSLIHGCLCFRYAYKENEMIGGLDDKFLHADELQVKINRFKDIEPSLLNNSVKEVLRTEAGFGIFRYEELL